MIEQIDQIRGRVNLLLVVAIFFGIGTALFGALAVVAYNQRTIAVTTLNQQVAAAVAKARIEQKKIDDAENAKANQLPFRTYTADASDGSFQIQFPKNWSIYTEHGGTSINQLLLIAALDQVRVNKTGPNTQNFKVELIRNSAINIVKTHQESIKRQKVKASTMTVSGISATKIEGAIDGLRHDGVKVIVPVRDKALVFTSESRADLANFNQVLSTVKIFP